MNTIVFPDDFTNKIARHLQVIYKSNFNEGLVNRILQVLASQKKPGTVNKEYWNESDIVLITYGDSLHAPGESPLKTLKDFLDNNLKESIRCVHILPFFPYTSDDGFAVSDFFQVNNALGSWEDIMALNSNFSLMIDLVINHVSSQHPWFKNFLIHQSPGRDFFIEADEISDFSQVIRPRSSNLFTTFKTVSGEKHIWTTFSEDQIDLNFANPEVLIEIIKVLLFYIQKNVRIIRLDAIAYLWKEKYTSCLHLPETHEVVKLLRLIASFFDPYLLILTETNVPNEENWSYFGAGDEANMVYQFSLPPLLLNALYTGQAKSLNTWARKIPEVKGDRTFLNFTASHDGIGIRPLEGIIAEKDIKSLLEGMVQFGGQISYKTNADGSLSPYEINITYADALKGTIGGMDDFQEERFLCSQAVMLSLKGIPAFYIHSLLATQNDYDGYKETGQPRSLNRRKYKIAELNGILHHNTFGRRIFNRLTELIKTRKQISAFHPDSVQQILEIDESVFSFSRYNPLSRERVICLSNLSNHAVTIYFECLPHSITGYADYLHAGEYFKPRDTLHLKPYQIRWLYEKKGLPDKGNPRK